MPKTLKIRVRHDKVEVFTPGNEKDQGSVIVDKEEVIRWEHMGGSHFPRAFKVRFVNVITNTAGSPLASGETMVPIPTGGPVDTKLSADAAPYWKYTVTYDDQATPTAHDPMIIIRSAMRAFAVSPAVLTAIGGAVVGALLTYFLLQPGMGG